MQFPAKLLMVTMLFASALAWANHHENDYSEERLLIVDDDGVETLEIEAGAGSLRVTGTDDADGIVVKAIVRIDTDDEEKAKDFIAKRLALTLERNGGRARLVSKFNDGLRFWSTNGGVDLDVTVPTNTSLKIDDGSGSIVVRAVRGDLTIDDGSGSVRLTEVGGVRLDDGSGSINISDVAGDVYIDDGSGGMTVKTVDGSVTIRDGAGSVKVDSVFGDLIIEEDGSGSVSSANVQGAVIRNDD